MKTDPGYFMPHTRGEVAVTVSRLVLGQLHKWLDSLSHTIDVGHV